MSYVLQLTSKLSSLRQTWNIFLVRKFPVFSQFPQLLIMEKCLTRKLVNFSFYALMLSLKLFICTVLCLGCTQYRLDTRRKLNVLKTFRRRPGGLLNVWCTFSLRLLSWGISVQVSSAFTIYPHQLPPTPFYHWLTVLGIHKNNLVLNIMHFNRFIHNVEKWPSIL